MLGTTCHFPSGLQHRVGDTAHEANVATAIHQAITTPYQEASEVCRRLAIKTVGAHL
jgi:hypothetical protein